MAFIATSTIRDALATWSGTFQVDEQAWAQHVCTYDAPELLQALNDLLVLTESKIIMIIPGRERYDGSAAPGIPMIRYRYAAFTIILAIRDEDGIPATGKSTSVSEVDEIIRVKDLFIEALVSGADLVPGVCLYPTDGGPQDIRDRENPDQRLWRAWVARFETPAGAAEYENNSF